MSQWRLKQSSNWCSEISVCIKNNTCCFIHSHEIWFKIRRRNWLGKQSFDWKQNARAWNTAPSADEVASVGGKCSSQQLGPLWLYCPSTSYGCTATQDHVKACYLTQVSIKSAWVWSTNTYLPFERCCCRVSDEAAPKMVTIGISAWLCTAKAKSK